MSLLAIVFFPNEHKKIGKKIGRIRMRTHATRFRLDPEARSTTTLSAPLVGMSYNGILIIKLFVHKHQFPRFCHRMIYIVLIIMFSVMVRTLFAIKGISKTIPEGSSFCFVHILSKPTSNQNGGRLG